MIRKTDRAFPNVTSNRPETDRWSHIKKVASGCGLVYRNSSWPKQNKNGIQPMLVLQCRRWTSLSKSTAFTRPFISNRKHHPHGYSLASMRDVSEREISTSCECLRHFYIQTESSRLYVMNSHDDKKTERIKKRSCEPSKVIVHSSLCWELISDHAVTMRTTKRKSDSSCKTLAFFQKTPAMRTNILKSTFLISDELISENSESC